MEEILSSIKRIIAEDGEAAPRARRPARTTAVPSARAVEAAEPDEVLELSELAPEAPPALAPAEPLVSPSAAQASRGSLDALTRMITRPEPEAVTAVDAGRSMDDFVADLLRPALRDWLDAHLPEIVERMVAKEIARITGNR